MCTRRENRFRSRSQSAALVSLNRREIYCQAVDNIFSNHIILFVVFSSSHVAITANEMLMCLNYDNFRNKSAPHNTFLRGPRCRALSRKFCCFRQGARQVEPVHHCKAFRRSTKPVSRHEKESRRSLFFRMTPIFIFTVLQSHTKLVIH